MKEIDPTIKMFRDVILYQVVPCEDVVLTDTGFIFGDIEVIITDTEIKLKNRWVIQARIYPIHRQGVADSCCLDKTRDLLWGD